MKPTTFIVIDVELPFKCNIDKFKNIFKEMYKAKITHEFIRNRLELSESVRLKLNGTFGRKLYLLDEDDSLYQVEFRVQTALWIDPITKDKCYVSIFPNFIKRYCLPCLHILEYISCHLGKDEHIFRYIDDPKDLLYYSDKVLGALNSLEKKCIKIGYLTSLKDKYANVYDKHRPSFNPKNITIKKLPNIYELIYLARNLFHRHLGVLSILNGIFRI